jgi:hypothetical protein
MSDKSELPFENHGSSLLLPLLSLIVAPTKTYPNCVALAKPGQYSN